MGSSESKPSNCVDQPWWSIENETYFVLNQPNLNEIFAAINEPDEIKYETVREKILAKLRDRKYSSNSEDSYYSCEDQNLNDNNKSNGTLTNLERKRTRTISSTSSSSRSNSESEPTSLSPSLKQSSLQSNNIDDTSSNTNNNNNSNNNINGDDEDNDCDDNTSLRVPQSLDEFREELRIKRIARQTALNDLRTELNNLRRQLAEQRELNTQLKNGDMNVSIEKKDATTNTEILSDKEIKNLAQTDVQIDNNVDILDKKIRSCDICIQTDDEIGVENATVSGQNESGGSCCTCNCSCRHNNTTARESSAIGNNNDDEQDENEITHASSDNQKINLKAQLAELQLSLQLANADNLSLTTELAVVKKQVASLKEVIACSRQMIDVREEQVQQLKVKLRQIEDSLADREIKIMSENLRQEYDRQLENIRNLRQLYEERARVSAAERENLLRQIAIKKDELSVEIVKCKTMEERISKLENELTSLKDNLNETKEERDDLYLENKTLKEEMSVVNKLFSQILIGFNETDSLDVDRLTTMLDENRVLLNEIATKEKNSEGACLPKLLFDIVNQANTKNENLEENKNFELEKEVTTEKILNINDNENENGNKNDETLESSKLIKMTSTQEIIGNLPKVWKILIEFLNHQKVEQVQFKENGKSEECYKSIQTPSGIRSEISVSKTYLKLKDLILEKKSLMKETNRLKTLNSHLEHRLDEQEKRLSVVSLELTKTWHLVGKMQRQHRQLHTHEQILRYHLQQKKRLLNELKEELEYCRRKWAAARAKTAESQLQCDDMRKEFAKRKLLDANNSAESGYSDGPTSSSDEEAGPIKKKSFKEFLEPSRKLERTNSISPVRSKFKDINVRGSSAPPVTTFLTELVYSTNDENSQELIQNIASTSSETDHLIVKTELSPAQNRTDQNDHQSTSTGAVPKTGTKSLKLPSGKKLNKCMKKSNNGSDNFNVISENSEKEDIKYKEEEKVNCSERIHKLEEQCKSLIAQVIETSENREKLEVQICEFQNELGSPQYPTPFDEYMTKKKLNIQETNKNEENEENSSCLTAKEEEYTNRRSERLKRLEEESKQLMSKIKSTTNRGKNMKTLLDKIHSKCISSREGSFDSCHSNEDTDCEDALEILKSKTDENSNKENDFDKNLKLNINEEKPVQLTPEEEAYTARRSERLKRLEEESKILMTKLSKHSQRGTRMNSRIDALHLRYGSEESEVGNNNTSDTSNESETEKYHEQENDVLSKESEGAIALPLENINENEALIPKNEENNNILESTSVKDSSDNCDKLDNIQNSIEEKPLNDENLKK